MALDTAFFIAPALVCVWPILRWKSRIRQSGSGYKVQTRCASGSRWKSTKVCWETRIGSIAQKKKSPGNFHAAQN